jgi:hypothetical protein
MTSAYDSLRLLFDLLSLRALHVERCLSGETDIKHRTLPERSHFCAKSRLNITLHTSTAVLLSARLWCHFKSTKEDRNQELKMCSTANRIKAVQVAPEACSASVLYMRTCFRAQVLFNHLPLAPLVSTGTLSAAVVQQYHDAAAGCNRCWTLLSALMPWYARAV